MRDSLIANVSSLLIKFTDDRDKSVREAVSTVRHDIAQGHQEMEAYAAGMESRTSSAQEVATTISNSLEVRKGKNKRLRDDGFSVRIGIRRFFESYLTTSF